MFDELKDIQSKNDPILDWIDSLTMITKDIGNPLFYKNVNLISSCNSMLYFKASKIKNSHFYRHKNFIFYLSHLSKTFLSSFFGKKVINFSSRTIVFWPTEPTHIVQQLPLIKIIKEKNIPYIFLSNRKKIINSLRLKGEENILEFPKINYESGMFENFINFVKVVEKELLIDDYSKTLNKLALMDNFKKCFFYMIQSINNAEFIIKHFNPRVIFIGNDLSVEGSSAVQFFKSKKIHTASLMHGNISSVMHRYHNVDKFFVFGKYDKENLMKLGVPKDKVFISGAPYLDKIKNKKIKIKKYLKLDYDQKYILIALSGAGETVSLRHHLKIINYLKMLSLEFPDMQFVVKPHRKDNLDYYSDIKENSNLIIPSPIGDAPKSIFSWLDSCDLVLTGASTVGNESLLKGVPVISMDFMDELNNIDFIKQNVSLHVKDYDSLHKGILQVINNDENIQSIMLNAENYLSKYYFSRDGNASRRIIESITPFF